jgi:hypothetical protein
MIAALIMLSPAPLRVAARSLHKRTTSGWALIFDPEFILQNAGFEE